MNKIEEKNFYNLKEFVEAANKENYNGMLITFNWKGNHIASLISNTANSEFKINNMVVLAVVEYGHLTMSCDEILIQDIANGSKLVLRYVDPSEVL